MLLGVGIYDSSSSVLISVENEWTVISTAWVVVTISVVVSEPTNIICFRVGISSFFLASTISSI